MDDVQDGNVLPEATNQTIRITQLGLAFLSLLLFIVTLPLSRLGIRSGSLLLQAADIFLGLAYLFFGFQVVSGRVRFRPSRLLVVSVIFWATLVVSLVANDKLGGSGAKKVVAMMALVFLPVLVQHLVTDAERIRWVIRAWVLSLAITAAVGVFGFLAFYFYPPVGKAMMCGYHGVPVGPYPRLCSPFLMPNLMANYLAVGLAVVVASGGLVISRNRVLWLSLAVGFTLFFTLSVAMAGGLLAAALAYRWTSARLGKRRKLDFLLPLGAAGLMLAWTGAAVVWITPPGQGHVSLGQKGDLKFWDGTRPAIWSAAARTFAENPIAGVGYAEYVAVTYDPKVQIGPGRGSAQHTPLRSAMEAHNVWLNVAGQAGVLGLGAFVVLLIVLLRPVFPLIRHTDPVVGSVAIAVVAGVLGAVAYHGVFAAIEEARHNWLLFGLAASLPNLLKRDA